MLLARRNNNSDWLTNWFEDNFFDTDLMPRTSSTAPATNIKENEKAYTMEVAAPGLKKEWEHYLRREFSYSNYQQCYTLPEDADREKISAKVADGILEVEIPKLTPKEEAKTTKNIEVK